MDLPRGRPCLENLKHLIMLDDWDGMGQRITASGTTLLKDVPVLPDQVIPLAQWYQRRNYIGASAQLIHCAIDIDIGLAALDDAVEWSRSGARPVRESGVDQARNDPYILHTVAIWRRRSMEPKRWWKRLH